MSRNSGLKILSIGEVLWDLFPDGPEMGGAAVNFGAHVTILGGTSYIISRVGSDSLGEKIADNLQERGISLDMLQVDPDVETGTVTVEISPRGEPSYRLSNDAAWDHIQVLPEMLEAVAEVDAVYFGSLAQRSETSRAAIQTIVAAAGPGVLRIFDANLREPFISRDVIEASLKMTDVLKVNDAELPIIAEMFGLKDPSLEVQADRLGKYFGLTAIACTLGKLGSFIWTPLRTARHPGVAVTAVDTVGAGDSFTAVLVMGLLKGVAIEEINSHANKVASFVCSRPGATPILPAHLRSGFESVSDLEYHLPRETKVSSV